MKDDGGVRVSPSFGVHEVGEGVFEAVHAVDEDEVEPARVGCEDCFAAVRGEEIVAGLAEETSALREGFRGANVGRIDAER
jgi:hypothetical protein